MTSDCLPDRFATIVDRFAALHPHDIPEHLQEKDCQRNGQEFDPQSYFSVLTHISMREGYTLDYLYHHRDGWGSEPFLYVRRTGAQPFRTFQEWVQWEQQEDEESARLMANGTVESAIMLDAVRTATRNRMLLPYLTADGTPDSFFELVVLLRLAGQFYLSWHANYNDLEVIASATHVEQVITGMTSGHFGARFSKEQASAARSLDVVPSVEVGTNEASVTYVTFSKWGGFLRTKETFRRSAPHRIVSRRVVYAVKYDCGVMY